MVPSVVSSSFWAGFASWSLSTSALGFGEGVIDTCFPGRSRSGGAGEKMPQDALPRILDSSRPNPLPPHSILRRTRSSN